jgi:anti-sigma factor RsiW
MSWMRRFLNKLMRPDPRKCEQARALMSDYLDNELDTGTRKQVERHVRFCQRCHIVLHNLRQTMGRLSGMQRRDPPGAADPNAAVARIAQSWRDQA